MIDYNFITILGIAQLNMFKHNLPYWQPSGQSSQDESSHIPQRRELHGPMACHHHGHESVIQKSSLTIVYQ